MQSKNAARSVTEICKILRCGRIMADGTCYGFHSPAEMWANFEILNSAEWSEMVKPPFSKWCWRLTGDREIIPKTEEAMAEYLRGRKVG